MIIPKAALTIFKVRTTFVGSGAFMLSLIGGEVTVLTIPLTNIIIAFIGAVVSIGLIKRKITLKALLTSLIGGTACGAFLPALFIAHFNLQQEVEIAVSFFLGLLGMVLIKAIYNKYETE